MNIVLKEGSQPFVAKLYQISRAERDEIVRHLDTWRSHSIIENSNFLRATPVLLVPKKNGESRIEVDYRRLNANIIRQPYPLLNVNDLLELFSGCTLFPVLLKSKTILNYLGDYFMAPVDRADRSNALI